MIAQLIGEIVRTEIGSEFHKMPLGNGLGMQFPADVADSTFVFSGRTAIETVLKNEPQIKKAMLPSYCCDSMIEPFRRAGIETEFYPVNYENGLIINMAIPEDVDCVFWCNYFGFKLQMPDMSDFVKRGGVVIEDITHSFLSDKRYSPQSKYLVASLRKWEPLNCGGYCASVYGALTYKPIETPSPDFIFHKRQVMSQKAAYLAGDEKIEKSFFLIGFSEVNAWLADNYSELKIDSDSQTYLEVADYENERQIRRENAARLYEGLKDNKLINFLFGKEDMDCPLFVPVLIEPTKRDIVRKKMIEQDIYCPVHWPHPNADCESNLYETELSLICDQRYTPRDMDRIVFALDEIESELLGEDRK